MCPFDLTRPVLVVVRDDDEPLRSNSFTNASRRSRSEVTGQEAAQFA